MNTLTEGKHSADFIISEGNGNISRDNISIGLSQEIVPGMVLKASGNDHVAWTAGATPTGIAIYGVITGTGKKEEIAAITRDCTVNSNQLVWADGATDGEIATGTAALKVLGIISR